MCGNVLLVLLSDPGKSGSNPRNHERLPAGAAVTQTIALQSVPTRLSGLPMARLKMAANTPARLQIKATSADIGLLDATFVEGIGTGADLRHRLNGRTVRDLNIIATYDAQT
jgi:hypothetical protein